jgi:DNA-binding GntR family transcriptional regulator
MPSALDRRTLTDTAADALRDRLLAGTWSPGTPLRQEALADQLGVSRIPLREALRRLEAEGLVVLQPHRGAVVADLPLADIAELFELRALLESDLARRAVPRLEAAHHDAIRAAARTFEAAADTGDSAAWGEANRRFHLALYAAAERPRTLEVVARLHAQSDRYTRLQLALTHGLGRAVREHRAIAVAARAGDARRTSTLVRAHILEAGHALARTLASSPSESSAR